MVYGFSVYQMLVGDEWRRRCEHNGKASILQMICASKEIFAVSKA